VAFLVDYGGGRIAAAASRWEIRSSGHFAERHGLVLIVALGESLVSVGAGAGSAVTHGPVMVAALLDFTATVCLWWLYFEGAAPDAGRAPALARAPQDSRRRQRLASDAYTLGHLPLIAGVIYFALGIHEVLTHVVRGRPGATLDWTSTVVLYGRGGYLPRRPVPVPSVDRPISLAGTVRRHRHSAWFFYPSPGSCPLWPR
jgi:low temperature requirement protein LtrA